jgi:hypothetical protein
MAESKGITVPVTVGPFSVDRLVQVGDSLVSPPEVAAVVPQSRSRTRLILAGDGHDFIDVAVNVGRVAELLGATYVPEPV